MKKLTAIIFTLTVCLSFFACQPSDKNEDLKPLSVNDGQYLYIEEDYSRGAMVLTESITKEIYERSYKDDKYPNVLIYEENGETFYFQTYITVILKANEISHNVDYKEFERDGNAFTATEIKTDIEGAEKLTLGFLTRIITAPTKQ